MSLPSPTKYLPAAAYAADPEHVMYVVLIKDIGMSRVAELAGVAFVTVQNFCSGERKTWKLTARDIRQATEELIAEQLERIPLRLVVRHLEKMQATHWARQMPQGRGIRWAGRCL